MYLITIGRRIRQKVKTNPLNIPFFSFKLGFLVSLGFDCQPPAPNYLPCGSHQCQHSWRRDWVHRMCGQKNLLYTKWAHRCEEKAMQSKAQLLPSVHSWHKWKQMVTTPNDKNWSRNMFRQLCKCRGRSNFSSVVPNFHICKMGKTWHASSAYLNEA